MNIKESSDLSAWIAKAYLLGTERKATLSPEGVCAIEDIWVDKEWKRIFDLCVDLQRMMFEVELEEAKRKVMSISLDSPIKGVHS